MSGAFIQVDVNDQAVLDKITKLQRAGIDLRAPFSEIGQHLDRSTRQRWDSAESPDGKPWDALKPSTLAHKEKNADKILVLNGHLRDSMAYEATSHTLRFGTNSVYAATHQFGAKMGAFGRHAGSKQGHPIPWGNIPARPSLGFSADDQEEILAILSDHLIGS